MDATATEPAAATGHSVILSDGRRLGYAEYGDLAGRPVIYCHGFPTSRLEPCLIGAVAEEAGVRLIAPDRPGYGLSDFQPGRRILDWPRDVLELADILGLGGFAVIGMSGGGPYALACAHACACRVSATAIVCGLGPLCEPELLCEMAPHARLGMALSRRAAWVLDLIVRLQMKAGGRWDPQRFIGLLAPSLREADAAVIAREWVQREFADAVHESVRNGPRGVVWDLRLYSQPWGFDLEETCAKVILWQGEDDTIVPASHGRYLARRLPNCDARFIADEGHFSLAMNYADEVLSELAGAQAS